MAGMPQLTMANNADFVRTVLISVGGLPYDLTGHKLELEVRSRPPAAETFLSIDSEDLGGIEIVDPPTSGLFIFTFTDDRLLRMSPGDYYYDVILTRPDNYKQNLGINLISLVQGITR
jgi:hypothetical protein